jgi:putative SOS response-associated peptidase YedK
MCGRFTQRSNLAKLADDFQARLAFDDEYPKGRFNIAPTHTVAVVRHTGEGRRTGEFPKRADSLNGPITEYSPDRPLSSW